MELSVDGRKVYVYTGNRALNPALETVVFIHGAAMDHSVWVLQSRYFAHHGRNVLALDLPGHGRSAGPLVAAIGNLADWMMRVLDGAGLARAALVGHSMGALAALEAAARYPERVRAAALLGVAVPMAVSRQLLDAAAADDHAAIDMITIWGHGASSHVGGNRAPGLWMAGEGLRLLERAAPGVLHNDLKACNDYQQGLASAAKVRCPALLILGQRDLMTPPHAAKALASALPQSRTVMLDCGHMLSYERPDAVLDALIEFL
ncbi:MAG: alpha/beta hydrolase [Gammaproteobacteria bacterium]